MDYAMRPVMAGMCKFESLTDCSIDLGHLALMNMALDARAENERRAEASRPDKT